MHKKFDQLLNSVIYAGKLEIINFSNNVFAIVNLFVIVNLLSMWMDPQPSTDVVLLHLYFYKQNIEVLKIQ